MNAQEAVEYGICDEILTTDEAKKKKKESHKDEETL